MGLEYSKDILAELKKRGISTYRIRKEKLLAESTVHKLRKGQGVSWDNLETICRLLNTQPGKILRFVPDDGEQ